MENRQLTPTLMQAVRKAQVDEELGANLYGFMADREKNAENKALLQKMSQDEKAHAKLWAGITKEDLQPSALRLLWMKCITVVLGFTFSVKSMQKAEKLAQSAYEQMQSELPEAAKALDDERRHEQILYNMLDEERLHYVGAMVLGLNDALVELTGAIAGVTFALANTRLVALTGIITGVSATLSMAASNYLAERADDNPNALKSSIYTGAAYLVTVALLVLPTQMYAAAFGVMIATVILIILFFNYYISVAKEEPFFRRFAEMAVISLSVAVISFGIGLLAKKLLGIDAL